VVDSPVDAPLGAASELKFGMTFDPQSEGVFATTASLFVDSDPCAQATVAVRGTAVFVDAHGGGGCSTGGGAGGGAIGLVLLGLLRRRRMIASAVFVVAFTTVARAEDADNIALTVFDPAPATTGTGFQLQSPEVGKHGDWVASAVVSHVTNPLVLSCVACAEGVPGLRNLAVVERSTLVELGGAYAFLDRFEAGARMSLYTQSGDPFGNTMTEFTERPASGSAAGDLAVHGKVRLVNGSSGKLGAALAVTLPTSSDHAFTGVDKPTARALLLGTLNPNTLSRRIMMSANLGGVVRAKARYANIEQGSGVAWGLGLSVRALDRVWIAGEVFGDIVPSGYRETAMGPVTTLSPTEWLTGLRWYPDHRFSLALAAGRGLTSSAGSPELRGVLVLSFAPGAPEIRPLHVPEPVRPEQDADRDGIADRDDRCKNEPEDKDLFDDSDGCPDPDNDGDGIVDADDKCPLDREDKDGFQDDDGCVDKDDDGDGLPDVGDKCPKAAEDKDGFEDLDGCPEPDNDGDGVLDVNDKCPGQPETINGNKDDDGCPDPGDSVIVLAPDRIETLDPIQFERGGAKLTKASFNVLGQVAATLRAHPEIIRVRVTAHVHPSAAWEKDQELSDKRAAAVREWLVQWGIAATRVEARGFGGTKPLAQGKSGESVNNRIELVILERK
jgi:large repetitive protein